MDCLTPNTSEQTLPAFNQSLVSAISAKWRGGVRSAVGLK
jgi:hypothetical protein